MMTRQEIVQKAIEIAKESASGGEKNTYSIKSLVNEIIAGIEAATKSNSDALGVVVRQWSRDQLYCKGDVVIHIENRRNDYGEDQGESSTYYRAKISNQGIEIGSNEGECVWEKVLPEDVFA